MKIKTIDSKRDQIQSAYKNHKTWAQMEHDKKRHEDLYFSKKMVEKIKRSDDLKANQDSQRTRRWNETKDINILLSK